MQKILAFGTSNHKNSINRQLAVYAASFFNNAIITELDINNFEMPIYSIEREKANGIPQAAHQFYKLLGTADILVISLSEHNGSYTTAFKNIFDWVSCINGKVFQDKPMLLLSTSTGSRGGITVLKAALERWPFMGGNIRASFSLPDFHKNYHAASGITNENLKDALKQAVYMVEQQ